MPTSKPNEEQLRLLQQYADILLPERDAELITVAGQVDVAAKAARDALQPPASLARSIDDAIRAHYALPNGELSPAQQPVVIPAMPRAPRLPDGLDNGTMSPHPRSRLRRWTEPLAATAAIVLVAALLVAVFRPGGADEDEDDAAGGSLATSTTSSATSGLPADAALPTAEDALAWAISRHGLTSRERDKPAYTAGVWLGTLGEVRAKQWYGGTTYAPHLEGIPEMPVWEIEVDDFIGMDVCEHQTDLSEFPECSWNHAIVVVNAVTGDELGFFVPERADAPVMPRLPRPVPEARVDSLDAAMRRAHELVPGLDGQPARIISARLMPMGDSWQMESNQDPATLVWQVEFLDADREAVCPDGSTCTPGHLTIVIDSLAGAEIAVRAGGPSPSVVLQPWPTPRPATPDPSTVQAPQPSANVDAIALQVARESMGATNVQGMGSEVTTPRQAIFKMQDRGIHVTVTWPEDVMDEPVWWFEAAGGWFQTPDCPDCPLAPKAYIGVLPDGEVLWAVTEIPPVPWFLPPATIELPNDAALQTAEDATRSAIRWSESQLGASGARVHGATLVTKRQALAAQEHATGAAMPVWDSTTYDEPVWIVQLTGASFAYRDCPDCPTGSDAVLILRASDESVYWIAIGTNIGLDPLGTMREVFPSSVPNDPDEEAVIPESVARFAVEYTRDNGAIVSGEPEVLVSQPATYASLTELGLFSGSYSPTCDRPLYVVVMKGDFDITGMFPGAGRSGDARYTYLAYTVDVSRGLPGSIFGVTASPTDEPFRVVLGLEEAGPSASPEPLPSGIGCEDMIVR